MLTNGVVTSRGGSDRPIDQPSRPVSQASDPHELRPVCSGKQRHLPYRSSHEWPPTSQTTDAKDKAALVKWSCGRSQISSYNGRRPHSSLDGTTPDQAYFASLPFRLAA